MKDINEFQAKEEKVMEIISKLEKLPFKVDFSNSFPNETGKIGLFFSLKPGEVIQEQENVVMLQNSKPWFNLLGYTDGADLIIRRASGAHQKIEHMPLSELAKDSATIDLFSDVDRLIIGVIFGLLSERVLNIGLV